MSKQCPRPSHLSRPPLERMLKIHGVLLAGRFPNAQTLAQELEVSSKTIQRDLEFMRDRLNMPVAYDASHKGFFYVESVKAFPIVQITEGEMFALFVAQRAIQAYQGTVHEKTLASAFDKLTSSLGNEISFDPAVLPLAMSFHLSGSATVDAKIFRSICNAVIGGEEIQITYMKPQGIQIESRQVRPYHIASMKGLWYVVGFDLVRAAIRTFALPRIRAVKSTGRYFKRDGSFNVKSFFAESIGVFRKEGESVASKIRIHFDAFASALVRERHWNDSQVIKMWEDGTIELELRVVCSEELVCWILGWGVHARVLAPASLVQRIRQSLQQMISLYC